MLKLNTLRTSGLLAEDGIGRPNGLHCCSTPPYYFFATDQGQDLPVQYGPIGGGCHNSKKSADGSAWWTNSGDFLPFFVPLAVGNTDRGIGSWNNMASGAS